METDILIVGGGLAGLSLADHLQTAGRDYQIVEARGRLGGRIKTETLGTGYYDLGPAWYWPGQLRMAALVERLGLSQFEQHYQGVLTLEDESGRVDRGQGFASMQGSYRLEGGLLTLIDAIAEKLPENRKHRNAAVTELKRGHNGVAAILSNGVKVTAQQVVLALPPRVAAEKIVFTPALTTPALSAMQSIATWMAGHAKAVAVYDTAFWREAGLSGDAMSRHGPLVEVHDASPMVGGHAALFGFIGIPAQARRDDIRLRSDVMSQLERLFGAKAATPRMLYIKDWARDGWTATPLDQAPLYAHPDYHLPIALTNLWDGALIFGGTEVAAQFGGYLEGALEAAENALNYIRP